MDLDTPVSKPQEVQAAFDWHRKDIEQRFGFAGGRFTDTSRNFTLGSALLLTCFFFGLLHWGQAGLEFAQDYVDKFIARGPTPYFITFLFIWGAIILLIKRSKAQFQQTALRLAVMPQDPDVFLTPASAKAVTERTELLADDYRKSILLNRIHVALSNLKNLGQVSDVASILSNQASVDEDQVASSFTVLNGMVWAIPVLGFIGTVLGLGDAMSAFGSVLGEGADMGAIRSALQKVTSGLSTAFDTTLLGLVFTLILQLGITFARKEEARLLDACADYCQTHILARLRINS